jgi:hypothetical protein
MAQRHYRRFTGSALTSVPARWTYDSRSSTRYTSSVRVWSIWPCSQTEILRGTFHPGRALVQRMHARGEPVATIAGTLGVGRATVIACSPRMRAAATCPRNARGVPRTVAD